MKLGIAIPTYNRPLALAAILRQLGEQVARLVPDDEVCVFVQDNATPDEAAVRAAVAESQQSGLAVDFDRHPCNIGPDANFVFVLGRAHGDYIWLLGDDDILRPDAVRDILEELRAVDGATYVAFSFAVDSVERPGLATTRLEYSSVPAYIQATMWHSSFISICIFRGTALALAMKRAQCSYYVGSCVVHLHIVMETIRASENPRIVLSPVVILDQTRAQYADWSKVSEMFVFGIGRFCYLLSDDEPAGKQAASALLKIAVGRMPVGILAAKAKGNFSFRGLPLILYSYGRFPLAWLSVFLAVVTPRFLLSGVRRFVLVQTGIVGPIRRWLKSV